MIQFLSFHSCSPAFHHFLYLGKRHHRRVPGSSHCKCAVRRAAFHSPLRTLSCQEAIDQSRGERIASTHTIEDLEVFPRRGLKELSLAVTHRSPVIARGRLCRSQGCRNHLKVRELLNSLLDHPSEMSNIQR